MWAKGFAGGAVDTTFGSNKRSFPAASFEGVGGALGDTRAAADALVEVDDGEPLVNIHI